MKKIIRNTPVIFFYIVFIHFMLHFQVFGFISKSQLHASQTINKRFEHYNPFVREMINIWIKYFTDQYYFPLFFILSFISMIYAHKRAKQELKCLSLLTTPSDIIYRDKQASGHSLDNIRVRFGGARNCLDVIVTPDELITRISFPFNYLFSGQNEKLLNRIKISNIDEMKEKKSYLKTKCIIMFYDDEGQSHRLELSVKNPKEFLKSLGKAS
jgi:hypothetical protein